MRTRTYLLLMLPIALALLVMEPALHYFNL